MATARREGGREKLAAPREGNSPVQKLADDARLSLTYNELQVIAQRDLPALAAQRDHLSNVIDVY